MIYFHIIIIIIIIVVVFFISIKCVGWETRPLPRPAARAVVVVLVGCLTGATSLIYLIYIHPQIRGARVAKEKSGRKFSFWKVYSFCFSRRETERLRPRAGHYCVKKKEDRKKRFHHINTSIYNGYSSYRAALYILIHPACAFFFFFSFLTALCSRCCFFALFIPLAVAAIINRDSTSTHPQQPAANCQDFIKSTSAMSKARV